MNTQLKDGLAAMPKITLHTPRDPALSAGVVAFEVDGLAPGDVIYTVNGRQFSDPEEFHRWLEDQPGDTQLTLILRRGARARHLLYEYHTKTVRLQAPRLVR